MRMHTTTPFTWSECLQHRSQALWRYLAPGRLTRNSGKQEKKKRSKGREDMWESKAEHAEMVKTDKRNTKRHSRELFHAVEACKRGSVWYCNLRNRAWSSRMFKGLGYLQRVRIRRSRQQVYLQSPIHGVSYCVFHSCTALRRV